MIARAPGKVVISGAYSVLEGAPAIVAAVDRYAIADGSRPAAIVTPEMRAALGEQPPPYVDASALRAGDIKLGLGSSAAILVASLGALELRRRGPLEDDPLRELVFLRALRAHAEAQSGGSGVDVSASTFGGVLSVRRCAEEVSITKTRVPAGVHLEVWSCGRPASTPELLGQVRELRARKPLSYSRIIDAQGEAAERAAAACTGNQVAPFLRALADQNRCLDRLGWLAGVSIVGPELRRLAEEAHDEKGAVLPGGAGGGDVVLFAGPRPPSSALVARARQLGYYPLELRLGARGVHAVSGPDLHDAA